MRALWFAVAACSAPAAPVAPPSLANAKPVQATHDLRLHVRTCGPGGIKACNAALLQMDIRFMVQLAAMATGTACGAHIDLVNEDWGAGYECQLEIRRGDESWLVDTGLLCVAYKTSGVPVERLDVMTPACDGDELVVALDLHSPAEHHAIRCRPDGRGLACSRDRGAIQDAEIAAFLAKLVAAIVAHRPDEVRAMTTPDQAGKPPAAYLAYVFAMTGEDVSKITALEIEDVADDGARTHVLGTAHTSDGRRLRFSPAIVRESDRLVLHHR